jgi:hypothetical protein
MPAKRKITIKKKVKEVEKTPEIDEKIAEIEENPVSFVEENEISDDENHQKSEHNLQKKPLQIVCRGTRIILSATSNFFQRFFTGVRHR